MARFASNDRINLKVGVSSHSEQLTSLEVIGRVGINSTTPQNALDLVGNANVDGNIRVSGVSTFQGNVHLGDDDKINLGDGNDLKIWHNGFNSIINDEGTGDLYLGGNTNVNITNGALSEFKAKFITDGAVELYYDNSKKFETTVNGIDVTGGLNVSGDLDVTGKVSIAGTLTYDDVTNVDSIGIITAKAGVHVIGTGSSVGIGTADPKVSLDISQNSDAIALPQGTTAQRPSGSLPYIRKNTTNNALEFYNGTEWVEIITDYFPTGSTILG